MGRIDGLMLCGANLHYSWPGARPARVRVP